MDKKAIIIIYIFISFTWIFATDFLINKIAPDQLFNIMETAKELFFILVTGLFVFFTIKKNQELKGVKEDEKRLSTLINSMVDFVCFKDGQGRWLEANQFGLKLFQLEHIDYRGKKDSELANYSSFYAEALQNCEVSDEDAWLNGKITRCEEMIPLPNGTKKTFDTLKVPLFTSDGKREGLVIIGRDISSLRLAEEKLRRSEKLSIVGELSASVAHEIRNPLTSLKGFVQLLKQNDSKNAHYFDIMQDELERINYIVGELLLLAKPQSIIFQKADIRKILNDVISLLEIQANEHNVIINENYEKNLEEIECEPNQLKQLFINLIKNAIEASVEGGKVSISVKEDDDENISILIKDTGCGISEERLRRIGEPFYSSKEKGTGLGLTVSFKIVQAHNGKIEFNSKINLGTDVYIQLPKRNKQEKKAIVLYR